MISASPTLLSELRRLMDLLSKRDSETITKEEYEELDNISRKCIPLLKDLIKTGPKGSR